MVAGRPFSPGLIFSVLGSLVTLFALLANPVRAQFSQDWSFTNDAFGNELIWWRPTLNSQDYRIWDFGRQYVVWLEYNCAYMTAICQNAENFLATSRARARRYWSGFAYDLGGRTTKRRQASCPSSWAGSHPCPEFNQPTVWRQDGAWWTTALDPVQVPNNVIRHVRDSQGRITSNSYLRYTCDEFPPATWVEGGSGLANNVQTAETRCAAYRCPGTAGMKIYGEQNWQARAHTKLQDVLKQVQSVTMPAGSWDRKNEPLLFYFRTDRAPASFGNGYPARVVVATPAGIPQRIDYVPLQKREQALKVANMTDHEFRAWADTVDLRDLEDYGFHIRSHDIHENDTFAASLMGAGLEGFGNVSLGDAWWDDAETELPPKIQRRASKPNLLPTPPVREADTSSGSGSASPRPGAEGSAELRRQEPTSAVDNDTAAPLASNATAADIEAARKMVEAAIAESGDLNRARYDHMARNRYSLKPGTIVGGQAVAGRGRGRGRSMRRRAAAADSLEDAPPPLFEVTQALAAAAALLAEVDAAGGLGANSSSPSNTTQSVLEARAGGTFWMETIARKGTVPWGDDPSYKVFRNVKDYGAAGDGKKDDTAAIKKAMNDGSRCGKMCNGSSTKNAIVYFPPGTYLVSSGIPVLFGTQVIGDANNWPTIIASKSFIGTSVLSTDEYTGGGVGSDGMDEEWYVNTASFYRQIRNLRIDVTNTRSAQEVACIHYQVAQATSLQFVELIAKTGTKQRGIMAENGSGGVLADIKFTGGLFGLWGGEQQFTAQRLTFDGCDTAVQVIWDWGWVWKSITVKNANVGFRLEAESGSAGNIGSATFLDSTFSNVDTAVLIAPLNSKPGSGSTGVVLENVAMVNVAKTVADTSGQTLLASRDKVDLWVSGPVYSPEREFYMGKDGPTYKREPSLLDNNGAYFERAKPQYEGNSAGDFVHLKDLGAAGDGVTDDTSAVQAALNANVGKIIFVDAGTYILTGTVVIPPGTKLVGETWSQFAASGPYFSDARFVTIISHLPWLIDIKDADTISLSLSAPRVMLQVGLPGTVGDVEMQDLIFTTKGPAPGAILVQWNIKAATPGSAGLWDCHARIGGASGTSLNPAECPAITNGIDPNCQGASMMMHVTKDASGYFENMWLWVADHMIDDPLLDDAKNPMVQNSVYVARGMLVESTTATWLYGTASEHSVYYQYNFNRARNVFAGFIQTESPYYQPTPKPPAPFEAVVGKFSGDPTYTCDVSDFDGCDSSWAVIMRGCENVIIASAGLYSWFSTYTQECIDVHSCQKALMLLENNSAGVRIQNLITIGAKYSIVQDGVGILATDNLNVDSHPSWSQITIFEAVSNAVLWITPKIWDVDDPTIYCQPPCIIKLPPWQGATSTLDYPLVTASGNGWTTTVTRAPVTVSNWLLEPVTVGAGAAVVAARETDGAIAARDGEVLATIWPTFAPTPVWPYVVFKGGDGQATTTRPTEPAHPSPPPPAGPAGPPKPPAGTWPGLLIVKRGEQAPIVDPCSFDDPSCNPDYFDWDWAGPGSFTDFDGDEDPEEQNPEDEGVFCPNEETSTQPPVAEPTTPTAPPLAQPSPAENEVHCYNSGAKADHDQIDGAINSFCGQLEKIGHFDEDYFREWSAAQNVRNNQVITIVMSLSVKSGCEWDFVSADCRRYLNVPADSCQCGGVNSKQGGYVTNNCLEWRLDPNVV